MNRLNEKVTVKGCIKVLADNNFKLFDNQRKDYNLNIVNIRSKELKAGKFDDVQVVFWFYKHKIYVHKFDVTLDPGVPYLLKPMNKKGAAIVVPNQYRGVWRLDKHKGKYTALVQVKPIEVFRDNNKDFYILDLNHMAKNPNLGFKIDRGLFGINCHRASRYGLAEYVGYYGAGCCVHQDPVAYYHFIDICKESAMNWGNSFTATWITEQDYDNVI